VAGLPLLAIGVLISTLLQKASGADMAHPIVEEIGTGDGESRWGYLPLFLLAAAWAPLVEETMFRGAFYHHLRRRLAWPLAALVVGVIFAAIHPQGWAAIPLLTAIAFVFAALREWRGSIIAPTVAHAINNGVVTTMVVLMVG
jgi:membrane protease YdiL (CAAX protease family)